MKGHLGLLVEETKSIRRELHRIPERSWQEEKTSLFLEEQLKKRNIKYRRCAGTGLLASVALGAKGRHVALRCDIDGLELNEENLFEHVSTNPGCMHGCGHDGHMAVMLGVLTFLKTNEHLLPGPVTCLFQPAEEGGHGAREMIAGGALGGIDLIYGWHNWPAIAFGKAACIPGPMMAANASFQIDVVGSGGHASQPEECRDPILASSALVLALQQIVSRKLRPQNAGVVSVTSIDGRSSETIIPEKVRLGGSVRMAEDGDISKAGAHIREISESLGAVYGVSCEVDFATRYNAVCNDSAAAIQLGESIEAVLGGEWQCQKTILPIMASEDFSYYLSEIPGAFALIGAGDGQSHSIPCHNSRYDFNDQLIEPMIRVLCLLVGGGDPLLF